MLLQCWTIQGHYAVVVVVTVVTVVGGEDCYRSKVQNRIHCRVGQHGQLVVQCCHWWLKTMSLMIQRNLNHCRQCCRSFKKRKKKQPHERAQFKSLSLPDLFELKISWQRRSTIFLLVSTLHNSKPYNSELELFLIPSELSSYGFHSIT